ncbi:hypothetical protein [Rubinisphaera italica]|uniref:Uncharacterized protein n=1 Tax=Rubinisphaera italica TaxID=2527969 RepID=A0A5C5XMX9_9PLAN|nr:hypothetical protein [Rubinisphaera italica]TWT64254.1 hypothetical protein Pan54_50150 [Rubinisphaera italica]
MQVRSDPFQKGEPLTAKDLEAIRREAKRFEGLSVSAPLQLSRSSAGVLLSLSGSLGGKAKLYKTCIYDSSYVEEADHLQIFTAVSATIEFDDAVEEAATITDEEIKEDDSNVVFIYNICNEYIPVGEYILGWKVGNEIVTYWRPPAVEIQLKRGYLTSALGSASGSSATMAVWEYSVADGWHSTGEEIYVMTRGSFPASSGVYCTAIGGVESENVIGGTLWEVIVLGCA